MNAVIRSLAMNKILYTCVRRNIAIVSIINWLEERNIAPVLVIERDSLDHFRINLSKEYIDQAIVVESFVQVDLATRQLVEQVRQKSYSIVNWVNTADETTLFFLVASEQLGIKSDFLDAYTKCRLKPFARKLLAEAGICHVKYAVINLFEREPPKDFQFPFIAKPVLGSGSEFVSVIESSQDWASYFDASSSDVYQHSFDIGDSLSGHEILLEELLVGQECQVDGFVEGGKICILSHGIKFASYDNSAFRETHGFLYRPFSLYGLKAHDKRVKRFCESVLRALEYNDGIFHMELKVSSERISLIEINPRPGGGGNVTAIEALSGVNLYWKCLSLWLCLQDDSIKPPSANSISFAVRYPKIKGVVSFIRSRGEIQIISGARHYNAHWEPLVSKGDKTDPGGAEQYLGVLLASDAAMSARDLRALIQIMKEDIYSDDFVIELKKGQVGGSATQS